MLNALSGIGRMTACMLAAAMLSASGAPWAMADGFSQVYNAGYGASNAGAIKLKPIDNRTGYSTNSNSGYGNEGYNNAYPSNTYSAYEQPTLYGYDRRDAPQAQSGILTGIENHVRDIWRSRTLRKGIVGAGAGVGLAALVGKNLAKGSLVGAGAGLGVSAIDNEEYFMRHPMARKLGKGALIGVGAAAVTGAAALWPAAAVGAGIGAGMHYINKPQY